MRFRNRREAGQALAARLHYLRGHEPVVLGLPHGGVAVAREVADALHAPLDALLVHKLISPRRPHLVIGAIGEPDVVVSNPATIRALKVKPAEFGRVARSAKAELARRTARYHPDGPPLQVAGRTVVLVDEGIATGATARAAIRVLRARGAGRIVLAVPVAPLDVLRSLATDVAQTLCPVPLRRRSPVGDWYTDFDRIDDTEVLALLAREPAGTGTTRP
ncbi:phosphoribosyltransferase [Amycolatopsis tolypomycina]|uniref:Predicted phosphoribosyltransferase n=1 Tax=Amycolatopsis tolypomycina TaxID=208445 RepID=A0A1H4U3W5_9PSEU|nr:phosphoribosyltransferase family protein [Amycolatopsis tolypomycina]SEC62934.1 Predicted phosphoribosyltransferase [Amycolatopsis tolypomycina]